KGPRSQHSGNARATSTSRTRTRPSDAPARSSRLASDDPRLSVRAAGRGLGPPSDEQPAASSADPSPLEAAVLSAILDTVEALVVVLDRKGRIVRFNRACERATGYAEGEVIGRPFWGIRLAPEDGEEAR